MSMVEDISGQLREALQAASDCQAMAADAVGYLEAALERLAAALDGTDDYRSANTLTGLVTAQQGLHDVAALLSTAQAGIQSYLAYLTRGNAKAASPPSSAPASSVPAAGPPAAATSGARSLRRIRKFAATRFGNQQTGSRHFRDHGRDFRARSLEEYVQSATDFLRRAQANDYPARVDGSGRLRIYDPNTNTFGVFDSDGTVMSYYKPESPTYWRRNAARWGDSVFWE